MSDPAFIVEIEQNLLGAILLGGDHRPTLSRITPQHFIEPSHAEIFRLAQAAQERYGTTEMPIVAKLASPEFATAFRDRGGVSLTTYLARLMGETPYGHRNMKLGMKALLNQWARLNLRDEAKSAADAANNPGTDPNLLARTMIGKVDELISNLRQSGSGANHRQSFSEAARTAYDASIAAKHRQGLTGISTGLLELDLATGGFQRRDLVLIGARPSMGKTTLATSIARNAATSGVAVGIFSLEMDNAKLAARMISDIALLEGNRIQYQDIIAGRLTDDEEIAAASAIEKYAKLPIHFDDSSGLTIAEIRAKTEMMIDEALDGGVALGMLIIDHLGKVKPSGRYAGNRNNEIGEITDGLKQLAREFDLSVVLLSQLSREVDKRDDKRPILSDLRDSGNIEQDADTVMFLHRPAYYLERSPPAEYDKRIRWQAKLEAVLHTGELSIAKQRSGQCRTIEFYIDVALSAVRNHAGEA